MAGPDSTSYNPDNNNIEQNCIVRRYNRGYSQANIKITDTMFTNTSDENIIDQVIIGSSNIGIRVGTELNYTTSESNNIIIGTNIAGTTRELDIIQIRDSSYNNLYIGNRAMYKSTGGIVHLVLCQYL
jgi:hypothetical protein